MNAIETYISILDIYKTFGKGNKKTIALNGINLNIHKGEIFALLGLNGAGKSTLTKILLGLCRPTSGSFVIKFPDTDRINTGYLPENIDCNKLMTGKSVLKFIGKLKGLSGKNLEAEINRLLDLTRLSDAKDKRLKSYSKGMVRRLGLAQAFINKPRLLFLDEPTDGLDPAGRKIILEQLNELKKNGTTIIINSHILSEIELIADRIGILHQGKLVAAGTLYELTGHKSEYSVKINSGTGFNTELKYVEDSEGTLIYADNIKSFHELLMNLNRSSIPILSVNQKRMSLEEVFFNFITNNHNDV